MGNVDNAAHKKHFLLSIPNQLGHYVIDNTLIAKKNVIINGKEVSKYATWREINQAVERAINDFCITKRASKSLTVEHFGINSSMCNKHIFPYYGCKRKHTYRKKNKRFNPKQN